MGHMYRIDDGSHVQTRRWVTCTQDSRVVVTCTDQMMSHTKCFFECESTTNEVFTLCDVRPHIDVSKQGSTDLSSGCLLIINTVKLVATFGTSIFAST